MLMVATLDNCARVLGLTVSSLIDPSTAVGIDDWVPDGRENWWSRRSIDSSPVEGIRTLSPLFAVTLHGGTFTAPTRPGREAVGGKWPVGSGPLSVNWKCRVNNNPFCGQVLHRG